MSDLTLAAFPADDTLPLCVRFRAEIRAIRQDHYRRFNRWPDPVLVEPSLYHAALESVADIPNWVIRDTEYRHLGELLRLEHIGFAPPSPGPPDPDSKPISASWDNPPQDIRAALNALNEKSLRMTGFAADRVEPELGDEERAEIRRELILQVGYDLDGITVPWQAMAQLRGTPGIAWSIPHVARRLRTPDQPPPRPRPDPQRIALLNCLEAEIAAGCLEEEPIPPDVVEALDNHLKPDHVVESPDTLP